MRLFVTVVLGLLIPAGVFAQQDTTGCKDTPLLTRLPGCYISQCSTTDFDAVDLTISTTADPRKKSVEGKVQRIQYQYEGKPALQVRRNAEGALKSSGYTIDFTGYDVPEHYVTAHNGAQWVAIQ